MSSKPTWICAKATPPGGMVATFIDSLLALTFLAERPALYWMLFQPAQAAVPRMTEMPSLPSTSCLRSTLAMSAMVFSCEESPLRRQNVEQDREVVENATGKDEQMPHRVVVRQSAPRVEQDPERIADTAQEQQPNTGRRDRSDQRL